jgi:hypothetical protein
MRAFFMERADAYCAARWMRDSGTVLRSPGSELM